MFRHVEKSNEKKESLTNEVKLTIQRDYFHVILHFVLLLDIFKDIVFARICQRLISASASPSLSLSCHILIVTSEISGLR